MKSGNRQVFADNIVSFIVDNDLDGIDIDWEYPGAPDIPVRIIVSVGENLQMLTHHFQGIPAGSKTDGDDYLEFLKILRNQLPDDKSLSICAPASFWYLKQL